jgi:hypothetical protein
MNSSPFFKFDANSMKAIDYSPWGGFEGFLRDTSNGAGGYATQNMLKRISPFLSKAVSMTASAVSSLPFDIVDEDGEVVDTSSDWQNKVGGLDNPQSLFYKLSSSLCGGKAYLIPRFTGKMIVDLQYVASHTVIPLITTEGLQWFSRASDYGPAGIYAPIIPAAAVKSAAKSVDEKFIDIAVGNYNGNMDADKLKAILVDANGGKFLGQMIYFWLPDSDIEIGPAKKYPLGTAMVSALMLAGMDNSIKLLADRNFVPATLVGAKGMPSAKDREVTENWLNRFVRGAFETFVKIINAENVSMVKMGAGMEDLKGSYTEIKKQGIEEIGAAFGIPAGIFLSDKAYSQEMDALIRLWYSSSEFIANYRCIEDTFNNQILNQWGYKLAFRPETIDAFQEDEATRAGAFRDFINAKIRPSLAAQILGMEMPEGTKYDDLDESFDKPVPVPVIAAPGQLGQPMPAKKPTTLNAAQQKDLTLWRQVAERSFKKGKGAAVDFECKALPEDIAAGIRLRLLAAKSAEDVVKAFEISAEEDSTLQGHLAIAQALNRLADAK